MKIRSGHGILIYSAGQGLNYVSVAGKTDIKDNGDTATTETVPFVIPNYTKAGQ